MYQSPVRNLYGSNDVSMQWNTYQQQNERLPLPPSSLPFSMPQPDSRLTSPSPTQVPTIAFAPPLTDRTIGKKIQLIVVLTFVFFILTNYTTYKILSQILSSIWKTDNLVLTEDGYVTMSGYMIMSFVFLILATIVFQKSAY